MSLFAPKWFCSPAVGVWHRLTPEGEQVCREGGSPQDWGHVLTRVLKRPSRLRRRPDGRMERHCTRCLMTPLP